MLTRHPEFFRPEFIRAQYGKAIVLSVYIGDRQLLVVDRRLMENHSQIDKPAKNIRSPFFIVRIDDGSQQLIGKPCRNWSQIELLLSDREQLANWPSEFRLVAA